MCGAGAANMFHVVQCVADSKASRESISGGSSENAGGAGADGKGPQGLRTKLSDPKDSGESKNTLHFFVGNPTVETTFGTLRLFRDLAVLTPEQAGVLPKHRSLSICILAVPAHYSAAEFCSWVSKFNIPISDLRILRDSSLDKYMVLLEFKQQDFADTFYRATNGKPFNTLEPESCRCLFVASVQFESYDDDQPSEMAPNESAGLRAHGKAEKMPSHFCCKYDSGEAMQGEDRAGLPFQNVVELPTCPVCLERLDASASGVFTTACQHTFHCHCLSKWTDSKCPVCRYCHNDEMHKETDVVCEICGASESLWICLLCGHIGCGRYKQEHGLQHFKDSGHVYAMELSTQRVWDYVGDGYVHRLIRNEQDGKFVEIPDPRHTTGGERSQIPPITDTTESGALRIKLEASSLDFIRLMSDQRRLYEAEIAKLRQGRVDRNDMEATKKKCHELQKVAAALEEENGFLKELNDSLTANQAGWEKKVNVAERKISIMQSAYDEKIAHLEAEVKDLMFYLDTQRSVENSADKEQIQNGFLLVSESESDKSTRGKKQRNKRSKKDKKKKS